MRVQSRHSTSHAAWRYWSSGEPAKCTSWHGYLRTSSNKWGKNRFGLVWKWGIPLNGSKWRTKNGCLNRQTDDWPMDFWVDKPIPLRKSALCVVWILILNWFSQFDTYPCNILELGIIMHYSNLFTSLVLTKAIRILYGACRGPWQIGIYKCVGIFGKCHECINVRSLWLQTFSAFKCMDSSSISLCLDFHSANRRPGQQNMTQ